MEQVQTSVDKLMELVQEKTKISVTEAAKALELPEATVQAWVDFLVEEHILGIEYKFTTPYIYVHSQQRLDAVKKQQHSQHSLSDFKHDFITRAHQKNIPEEKITQLWQEHLRFTFDSQKKFFFEECKKENIKDPNSLYERYLEVKQHEA